MDRHDAGVAAKGGVLQREMLPPHPDVRMAAVLERQHGVISRAQLSEIGMTKEAIRYRVSVRRLRRVDTSVFAVAHRLTPQGRCLAAVLGTGEDAVASYRWAAALHQLRRWPTGRVEITTIRRGTRSRRGVLVHASRSLDAEEVTVCDGVPCTSVARTLLDLADVASRVELERALEQAVRLNLFDAGAFADSVGRRRTGVLRELIAQLPDEPPPFASELERRFYALVRRAGLPLPVVNAHIGEHQVDFHWPDHGLVVETDGRAFHDSAVALRRDRRRELDLELAGRRVLRIGWSNVAGEPDRVVALLRRYLPTA